jgi:5-methylcytosine-specific restriction endonuclease McrA
MYCGMTEVEAKQKFNERLHRDHAYNNGSNEIDNCILACKSCNCTKHKRDWDEWYTSELEFYSEERKNKIEQWLNKFRQNDNINKEEYIIENS